MSKRFIYMLSFLAVTSLLLFGLYLQFFKDFVPCPLCTLQRVCFGMIGLTALMGVLVHKSRFGSFMVNMLGIVFSGFGIFFAGRQTWLQLFPNVGSKDCGVSLNYMIEVLPLKQVMQKILAGSAECATRSWEFLTLSMPQWALIWFVGFLCLFIYLIVRKQK